MPRKPDKIASNGKVIIAAINFGKTRYEAEFIPITSNASIYLGNLHGSLIHWHILNLLFHNTTHINVEESSNKVMLQHYVTDHVME
jgi:hypothetical protein